MHYPKDAFSIDGSETIFPRSNTSKLQWEKDQNESRGMSIVDIVELSRNYGKHTNTLCLPSLEILEQYYNLENTEEEGTLINNEL